MRGDECFERISRESHLIGGVKFFLKACFLFANVAIICPGYFVLGLTRNFISKNASELEVEHKIEVWET